MFTTRTLQQGDAEMANEWLFGWNRQALPLNMYPDSGLVCLNEDKKPVYVGFIWKSNSGLAQLGFITRNPYVRKLPKNTRKDFLQKLKEQAHLMGFEFVITWTENKLLVEDFKELGFRETSNKCSELINYK